MMMAQRSAWLEAKLEAPAGVYVRHLCCGPVLIPLSRQPESSSDYAIGVSYFVMKMCQFII